MHETPFDFSSFWLWLCFVIVLSVSFLLTCFILRLWPTRQSFVHRLRARLGWNWLNMIHFNLIALPCQKKVMNEACSFYFGTVLQQLLASWRHHIPKKKHTFRNVTNGNDCSTLLLKFVKIGEAKICHLSTQIIKGLLLVVRHIGWLFLTNGMLLFRTLLVEHCIWGGGHWCVL